MALELTAQGLNRSEWASLITTWSRLIRRGNSAYRYAQIILSIYLKSFLSMVLGRFVNREDVMSLQVHRRLKALCILVLTIMTLYACSSAPKTSQIPEIYRGLPLNEQLFNAVEKGDLQMTEVFIRKGANVNFKNNWGFTPLGRAAENGWVDIAEILVESGADVSMKDKYEITPLMHAALFRKSDMVQFLLRKKVDINDTNSVGITALMYAAQKGSLDIAEMLVENGADSSLKDTNGWKAIDYSIAENHVDITAFLENYVEK
jgi:hypothetical protein